MKKNITWKLIARKRMIIVAAMITFSVWYYFALPEVLFDDPYSTVLESRERELLSAAIANDGQWRFPEIDEVPEKFATAVTTFEDKRFYRHVGVDGISFINALRQNIKAGKIVRGGSTITMQVVRLSRKGKARTIFEKIYEIILATRLELRYSKKEILNVYASHAPFGGNVVGLEAACWRYLGRDHRNLSWGEAAFLAVLPNAPSLIHPGKNRDTLLRKRNRLLDALRTTGVIDSFSCDLAKHEQIPASPLALPRHARHLLTRSIVQGKDQRRVTSTISFPIQARVEEILQNHQMRLAGNEIHNAAAIVADVNSGEVLAYVGNVWTDASEGTDVDVITSPRSTGSILKPFLYAAALDEGLILPRTLLPDIPTFINGFVPQNFTHEYDGAVNADEALIRSLNIPAVFLLKDYRYEKFHSLLKNIGLRTLNKPADHYGLSLILGGAEGNLWDITGAYASMARTLNRFFERPGKNRYTKADFHPLRYTPVADEPAPALDPSSWLSASATYQTFETLQELRRPREESGWRQFESSRRIAWKTGTSFGFRDGWAVGVTPEYVVGIWVGNADGEGRPGLTGIDAAAPILFDVFSSLGETSWFMKPRTEMLQATICRASGQRNGPHCPVVDTLYSCARGLETSPCIYHKKLHLTNDGKYQVNTQCASIGEIRGEAWFVLPPVQEHYFKSKNLSYVSPPPFKRDCWQVVNTKAMDLIYPKPGSRLFIPRDITGKPGSAIFQLAHRNGGSEVHWYLDGNYLGSTQKKHDLALNPSQGKHTLTLIDETGSTLEETFEVLSDL